MFDLYCNADRFWHEVSRANELCSPRSGSKVRIILFSELRAYLMNNNRENLRVAVDDGTRSGKWKTLARKLHLLRLFMAKFYAQKR